MVDFIEKARQGRIVAVASLSANTRAIRAAGGNGMRFRSSNHHENVVFLSSRGSRNTVAAFG